MLSKHPTGKPLRDTDLLPDMLDTAAAVGGAQKFPAAASQHGELAAIIHAASGWLIDPRGRARD